MRVDYAAYSDTGGRRDNEDGFLCQKGRNGMWLFAVADGLGGHSRGKEAAQSVMDTLERLFDEESGEADVRYYFEAAQNELMRAQQRESCPGGMKTTLNMLMLQGGRAYTGHVGDSRTYLFRRKKQMYRTRDHSVPQALLDAGQIAEEDIRTHPDRGRLTRVMGGSWDACLYETEPPRPVRDGDAFLLCTDGFWEWVEDETMERTLRAADSPKSWLEDMEDKIAVGQSSVGMDNRTAVAVWLG